MSGTDEKGKFDTNISQQVIEEALRSVRKHTGGGEVTVDVEPSVAAADAPSEPPADGSPEAAAARKELEEVRAQLDFSMAKGRELMEKLKDQHEKMLRAAADLDNYKKRAQKEKEEGQKYGNEKLLKAFLPVLDNLDRALEHGKSPSDFASFVQGVAMTRKLFDDTMAKQGVRPFTAVGQPFDPRFHEAMQQVERADLPPNQVVAELLRGFMLNDRLMRPALVMVSKPPVAEAVAASASPVEGEKEAAAPVGGGGADGPG